MDLIPVEMNDALRKIFGLQFNLQTKIRARAGQCPIAEQTTAQRIEAIKGNIFALEHELHELADEMKWKDWTAGEPFINRDAAVKELVDALHFLVNIALHLDVSVEELFTRYVNKNETNHKRQDENYDGVSTKCPKCRRALEDITINKVRLADGTVQFYWCDCGEVLDRDLVKPVVTDQL